VEEEIEKFITTLRGEHPPNPMFLLFRTRLGRKVASAGWPSERTHDLARNVVTCMGHCPALTLGLCKVCPQLSQHVSVQD